MAIVHVELPKFPKKLEQLKTIQDKWLFFLKQADTLEIEPESFQKEEVVHKAFDRAIRAHLSKKEREILDKKEQWIAVQRDIHRTSLMRAEEKGMEKGMEKGKIEGMKEALEKLVEQGVDEGEARRLSGDGLNYVVRINYSRSFPCFCLV